MAGELMIYIAPDWSMVTAECCGATYREFFDVEQQVRFCERGRFGLGLSDMAKAGRSAVVERVEHWFRDRGCPHVGPARG